MKKVLFIVGLLGVLLAGCQPKTQVVIKAFDIGYDTQTITIKAGEPVRLVFTNDGVLEHDFVIEKIALEQKSEHSSGHSTHGAESMDADLHVSVAPDGSSYIDFTVLEPGTYEYFCSVEGHKEAGMHGTLIVE
jgi:uncharacterized cupredoxin-like copper-binding protein